MSIVDTLIAQIRAMCISLEKKAECELKIPSNSTVSTALSSLESTMALES